MINVGKTDGASAMFPFAWRPNLERLKAEARTASDAGVPIHTRSQRRNAGLTSWTPNSPHKPLYGKSLKWSPRPSKLRYWKHDLQSVWKVLKEAANCGSGV